MPRRYPWESTTLSTPLSKLKYSSPYVNVIASTPTTITTKTIPISTTTNSYRRVTAPFITAPTTVSRYTQTTVNHVYTDRYKTKYNNSSSGNSTSNNNKGGIGGSISTTTRRNVFNFFNSYRTVSSTTPKLANGLNDVNFPRVSPFKYKNGVTSLSTTTKGYQKGLRNDGRGKRILNQICIICIFLTLFLLTQDVFCMILVIRYAANDHFYIFYLFISTLFALLSSESRYGRLLKKQRLPSSCTVRPLRLLNSRQYSPEY